MDAKSAEDSLAEASGSFQDCVQERSVAILTRWWVDCSELGTHGRLARGKAK